MVFASALTMMTMLILGLIVAYFAIGLVTVRFGRWAKSYLKLSKRYHGHVFFPLGKPRMSFSYGDNHCVLRNTTSRHKANRQTQLVARWLDRRLKLLISSNNDPSHYQRTRNMQRINVEAEIPGDHFTVFSNQPEVARRMLNATTIWQIRQLIQLDAGSGVGISIQVGQIRVSKPGYMKEFEPLDDFVRHSLDLLDQFKLTVNRDIEFVADDDATVVEQVTCPICSGTIYGDMVSCVRCKNTALCGLLGVQRSMRDVCVQRKTFHQFQCCFGKEQGIVGCYLNRNRDLA